MEVKFDEKSGMFAIADLTFEQLNHVFNCVAFAAEYGAVMPRKEDADPIRRRVNIDRAKRYKK